ncbi:MAG: TonB-dependent receptor [Bacteroidales bacterium]|nr:TonB-dependent receptor [Bacteroidales bacterium]
MRVVRRSVLGLALAGAFGSSVTLTFGQDNKVTITGTVLDNVGTPVVGAAVVEQGTTNGSVTDTEGRYSLKVSPDATLVVSFLGYETVTEALAGRETLDFTLFDESNELSELIVVGYGVQKKVNLTGAVSVVGGDELKERPVTTATQALQGMVPGLQIASSSGALDSNPSINVRGTATIGQGTSGSPLVLIDGSEGDINAINPQDIESISVLKDAASSSIYGSRAPFGVILITTKSGKEGKAVINYNNSFRYSGLIRGKHMMNSVDFAAWVNDTHYNGGEGIFFNADRMAAIKEYRDATPVSNGVRRTSSGKLVYAVGEIPESGSYKDGYGDGIEDNDWYETVYKDRVFAQEHNLSVSGGKENLKYYLSFNYLNNEGFMRLADDKFTRFAGTAKISTQLKDWLRVDYGMRWTRTDYERPSAMTSSLYNDMTRQGWPVLPLYDPNGNYYCAPSPALGLATKGKDTKQRDLLNHTVALLVEPISDWKTHFDFNYRTDNATRHWDSFVTYNHDVNNNPTAYDKGSNVHEDEFKENYINFQAYTEYDMKFAEYHNVHVMAGFQTEQTKKLEFGLQRDGVLDNAKPEVDLTSGLDYDGKSVVPSVNGARNQWQTAGFFGRINYNYDEKYLLEFNIRRDGTSRFRTNRMWKTFPSASIGWNIAREDFWESLADVCGTLKLRASYGALGNQNTTNWYQTYQTISYKSSDGSWLQNGKKPNTTSAPGLISTSLTWERVQSYDLGLDYGFLSGRLKGSFDFFIRDTKDMVGNAPELPSILGTAVPVSNNTDLRTRGWELTLGWNDMLDNGFRYGVSFNLSDSRTKITKYTNNPTESIDTYIQGRYTNEIWGFETVGIAQSDSEMDAHLAKADQSSIGDKWAAGDIMYADLNGDGKVNRGAQTLSDHGDLKVIGNSTPRFMTGIDLNASFKGFDFRAFFQGVLKRDYGTGWNWGGGKEYLFGATNSGLWWCAGLTDVKDYYRDENSWSVQNGYMSANKGGWLPRPLYSDKNIQEQTRYLLNAAYMRLKNIQLGYTLPETLVSKWGLSNVRFYLSGENVLTISDMPKQFDPETIDNRDDHNNGYPLSRTFAFGLNLTF